MLCACVCFHPQRPKMAIRSPRAAVVGDGELPNKDAGN